MISNEAHYPGTGTFAGIAAAILALLLTLGALGFPGSSAAGAETGTLTVTKGGDRNLTSDQFSGATTYATGLGGARFEYSTGPAGPGQTNPDDWTWTEIPGATDSITGRVSIDLPQDTYFVREKGVPTGFDNFGRLTSLTFGGTSTGGGSPQPYVARVKVSAGSTTYAYPHSNAESEPSDWTPTNQGSRSNNGSPFLNVRNNGVTMNSCGQNILMVLDRSGSIEGHESDYRAAARTFISSLDGTPTQIGIISFNDSVNSYSPAQGDATRYRAPLDLSVPGNAGLLNQTVDAVYDNVGNGTNWDGALKAAAQAKGFAGTSPNPDLVVFITDGNPTLNETDNSGDAGHTSLADLSAGIASANLVKNQPSRSGRNVKLLAIGVGSGVTADNLKVVSGPTEGITGDYATPTIPELEAYLKQLAASQCGALVHIRKQIGDSTDNKDWNFTVDKVGGSHPQQLETAGSPAEALATFPNLPAAPPTRVYAEENATGQPMNDFTLSGVDCRKGSYTGTTGVLVTPDPGNPLSYSFSVNRGDDIYCTYTNEKNQPNLTTLKTAVEGTINAGDNAGFTVRTTNTGTGTARNVTLTDPLPDGVSGAWTITDQPGGDPAPCRIVTGGDLDRQASAYTLECDYGDLGSGESRSVTVTAPTSFESCTEIDNTATSTADNAEDAQDSATVNCRKPDIIITKEGNDHTGPGQKVSFTIKVTNRGEGTARDVMVTDPLSDLTDEWSIVSQSEGSGCEIRNHPGFVSAQGAPGESGQTLVCLMNDLPSGQSRTVTVRSTFHAPSCSPVENTATVTTSNAPEAEATASVPCVNPKPKLHLRKKADRRVVTPGQRVHYTIMVRNSKIGSVATDLTMCDRIPPHMTVVNRGSGHFRNGKLCWSIPRLNGSKHWSRFHYTTKVDDAARAGQHLRNTVSLEKLRAHWTVRVKQPPVRHRRRQVSRVTG